MDRILIGEKLRELLGRYKYVLLILGVGVLLMLIPENSVRPEQEYVPASPVMPTSRAEELEEILSQIAGVGKVKVLLTESAGSETVYQTDQDRSQESDGESIRVETVIVSDANRDESGLVRTVTPPTYLGAIIVCQGGDSPTVRLFVAQAVSNVTGISYDRITVLKMK